MAGPREAQQMPDAHEAEYDRIHFQNELQALELLVARDIQFVPPQLNGPAVSRTLQKQQLDELDHTITSLELEIDMEERTRAARNDHKVAMNRLQTNIYKRRAAIMKNRLCANDDAQLFDKAVEDQGLQNRVVMNEIDNTIICNIFEPNIFTPDWSCHWIGSTDCASV